MWWLQNLRSWLTVLSQVAQGGAFSSCSCITPGSTHSLRGRSKRATSMASQIWKPWKNMENVGRLGVDPEGSGSGLMFPSIERLSVSSVCLHFFSYILPILSGKHLVKHLIKHLIFLWTCHWWSWWTLAGGPVARPSMVQAAPQRPGSRSNLDPWGPGYEDWGHPHKPWICHW